MVPISPLTTWRGAPDTHWEFHRQTLNLALAMMVMIIGRSVDSGIDYRPSIAMRKEDRLKDGPEIQCTRLFQ